MQSEQSSNTWLTLDDRPPPVSRDEPGARCLCWFHTDNNRRAELGYYLGSGKVRLLGASTTGQVALELERITSWRPFSEKLMEEFENA